MKRSTTRIRHEDRGVVAIEMVLVLPLLLMLVIGVVVLGNALSIKTQTVGLARDGARAASLLQPLPADTVVVSAPCPALTDPTKFVTVQATKPITLRSVPFLPTLIRETITETVTMRCGG